MVIFSTCNDDIMQWQVIFFLIQYDATTGQIIFFNVWLHIL